MMENESFTNQFRKSLKEKGTKAREKLTAVKDKAFKVGDNTKSAAESAVDSLADSITASVSPKFPKDSPTKLSPTSEEQSDISKDLPQRRSSIKITTALPGTLEYLVQDRDTLTSIAAKFYTTPSEIKKINKLMNHFIFPGQKLFVPDKDYVVIQTTTSPPKSPKNDNDDDTAKEFLKEDADDVNRSPNTPDGTAAAMRQASKIPGHAARVAANVGKDQSNDFGTKLDAECLERFIKISVKHITDGEGVVSGTLLVTPNAVMFDPNVSDPLVLEHGADKYGVMTPIETVMSAAIFHDIAAMKLSSIDDEPTKSEVYHASSCPLSDDKNTEVDESNNKCECAAVQNNYKDVEPTEVTREELLSVDDDQEINTEQLQQKLTITESSGNNGDSKEKKIPHPISIPDQGSGDTDVSPKTGSSFVGRTLGSISSSISGSFPGSPNISSIVDFSSGLFKGATNADDGTDKTLPAGECAVKYEDKLELFKSIEDIIPKPVIYSEHAPLYLCLKIGKPLNKRVSDACPFESYGKKRKKPEYWFSIPRDKVDKLYAFFLHWTPNIYDSDNIDPKEKGFVVIDDDDLLDQEEVIDFERSGSKKSRNWEGEIITGDEDLAYLAAKGRLPRICSAADCLVFADESYKELEPWWEIVNIAEARRRMSICEDESTNFPEMLNVSLILNDDQIKKISKNLPARTVGYPWRCVYSTDKDGFSLKSLYRSMKNVDSVILLVIKDTNNRVFGAQVSCPLKISEHFYGTGESFLFTFYPEFKKFSWSGSNQFFVKGNQESLAIGSGKGKFGLWLDGDIYHGRTHHCDTFNNDLLTSQEDFVVKGMEAWIFHEN